MTSPEDRYPANIDASLLGLIDQHLAGGHPAATPPPMQVRSRDPQRQPYGAMNTGLGIYHAQPGQQPASPADALAGAGQPPEIEPPTTPVIEGGGNGRAIIAGAALLTIVGVIAIFELKPSNFKEPAANQLPLKADSSTSRSVSVSPSATPSPSVSESGTPSDSLVPSETTTDSLIPTTSTAPTPTESILSPTDIPAFNMEGMSLSCKTIGTVAVNEEIPMGISQRFSGSLQLKNNKTGGFTATTDPNTYNFFVSTKNNVLGYDVGVPISGTAPLEVCLDDPASLFVKDPSAPKGTNAYTVEVSTVPLQLDASNLDNLVPSEMNYLRDGNGVPKVLVDLCKEGAVAEQSGTAVTPAESQACEDKKLDWSDPNSPPASTIFNQVTQQVNNERAKVVSAALATLDEQLDNEQKTGITNLIKTYVAHGLQKLAAHWAKIQSKALGGNVPTPNVIIDQYTGDPQSLLKPYLNANPGVKNTLASTIPDYRKANPKVEPSSFYVYDGQLDNKSLSVSAE